VSGRAEGVELLETVVENPLGPEVVRDGGGRDARDGRDQDGSSDELDERRDDDDPEPEGHAVQPDVARVLARDRAAGAVEGHDPITDEVERDGDEKASELRDEVVRHGQRGRRDGEVDDRADAADTTELSEADRPPADDAVEATPDAAHGSHPPDIM